MHRKKKIFIETEVFDRGDCFCGDNSIDDFCQHLREKEEYWYCNLFSEKLFIKAKQHCYPGRCESCIKARQIKISVMQESEEKKSILSEEIATLKKR